MDAKINKKIGKILIDHYKKSISIDDRNNYINSLDFVLNFVCEVKTTLGIDSVSPNQVLDGLLRNESFSIMDLSFVSLIPETVLAKFIYEKILMDDEILSGLGRAFVFKEDFWKNVNAIYIDDCLVQEYNDKSNTISFDEFFDCNIPQDKLA